MNILVINAGSSSVKYQLIDMNDESVLASGIVERIGIDAPTLKHQAKGKDKLVQRLHIQDHSGAVKVVVDTLLSKEFGVISSIDDIAAVGHRIAHGGDKFTQSILIDQTVIQAIKDNIELAPLHNPANIIGIEACQIVMSDIPMVAVFDTAFHQTLPKEAYLYGLSYDISTEQDTQIRIPWYLAQVYCFAGELVRTAAFRAADDTAAAPRRIKVTGRGIAFDSVVAGICDIQITCCIEAEASGVIKLIGGGAGRAKIAVYSKGYGVARTVCCIPCDTIVVCVGDIDHARGTIVFDTLRIFELVVARTP